MAAKNKIYKKKFRKFLYENEIEQVMERCSQTRFSLRNQALLLITYMHAFRAGEVCNLKWKQIDFKNNIITIIRQKGGIDGIQPLWEKERNLLLRHYNESYPDSDIYNKGLHDDKYVFTSSRWGEKFEPSNFYRLTLKLGKLCGFDFIFTPHMLRHARGTFLANQDIHLLKIKALLGHARVSSTEIYTHMAANKFNGINSGSIFM